MNPYTLADLPFFIALPLLLVGSAFFSGSETALFAMSSHARQRLVESGGVVGHAIKNLLDETRMLLITLLLGNMTINVFYFVITSVLLLKLDPKQIHPLLITLMAMLPLVMIIIFGEVLPKMLANLSPSRWTRLTSVPLLGIHRLIAPLRIVLDQWVISPLSRLVRPGGKPSELSNEELRSLVELSLQRGVINRDEEQLLHEVVQFGRMKVRDVMVPRVDVNWLEVSNVAMVTREMIRKTQLRRLPVCDHNLDHVLGVIDTRKYLLAERKGAVNLNKIIQPVNYVPEQQRVDQLLVEFRKKKTHVAIVVDEYGGTAGLVTLKDVIEQIVGDLDMDQAPGEGETPLAESIDNNTWRVSGRLSVYDWMDTFGDTHVPDRVATVGGLVMALLKKTPTVGDCVTLGNVQLEVETMTGLRIETVMIRLTNKETQFNGSNNGDNNGDGNRGQVK